MRFKPGSIYKLKKGLGVYQYPKADSISYLPPDTIFTIIENGKRIPRWFGLREIIMANNTLYHSRLLNYYHRLEPILLEP
jgi:hypothetical protein